MYARVSRSMMHPGKIGDAMAVLHNHGLARLQQAQGFVSGLWLFDPETLRALQIILWEHEADFERLTSSGAAQETTRMLQPLMAEMSPPQTFAVLHGERVPEAGMPTHAIVAVPQSRPGTEDEAIGVWRAAVLPALKEREGYAGSAVLADQAAQQVMDISMWESEATMRAAMRSDDLRNATQRMMPFMTGEPAVHQYQVQHLERGASPTT